MLVLLKSYLKLLKYFFKFFYWQFRWLNNAKTGTNGIIHLPLKFEGNGAFTTQNNYNIGKKVVLSIAKNGLFETKNNLKINDNTKIIITANSSLKANNNLTFYKNSTIQVAGNWIWGNDITIQSNVQISAREKKYNGNLNIGYNCIIGDNTIIDTSSDIIIGNNVSIGINSILYTHNHIYANKDVAAWQGGVVTGKIIIEDGAWIAAGVIILPGVKIGKRAVVAAGAVVATNVEADCIYGGVPAKLIKKI